MTHTAAWICAGLATLLAGAVVFVFGISPLTILVSILLLACPIVVTCMTLRLSRQCQRDIRGAVELERRGRKTPLKEVRK